MKNENDASDTYSSDTNSSNTYSSDTYSSPEVDKCLDTVFRELNSDAQFDLTDRRFQLAVVPFSFGTDPAWAYFPVHRRRGIAKHIQLRPEARVLSVIFEPNVEVIRTKRR
jgi:hypothetical protein